MQPSFSCPSINIYLTLPGSESTASTDSIISFSAVSFFSVAPCSGSNCSCVGASEGMDVTSVSF